MLLIAATLATTCSLIAVFVAGPHQPSYKGRTLARWVCDIETDGLSVEKVKALQAMGTNATPFLLKWIRYETPAWKAKALKVVNRGRAIWKKEPLDDQRMPRANGAATAIWILQEQSPTLWAECTNIMTDATISTNVQYRAYGLLFKRAWGDPILMPYIQEQLVSADAPPPL